MTEIKELTTPEIVVAQMRSDAQKIKDVMTIAEFNSEAMERYFIEIFAQRSQMTVTPQAARIAITAVRLVLEWFAADLLDAADKTEKGEARPEVTVLGIVGEDGDELTKH